MKIATWSVNSVRARLPYLLHWLDKRQPAVVALQKTRVSRKRKHDFPRLDLERAGYHAEACFAEDQWRSVAVLIRRDLLDRGLEPAVQRLGLSGRESDGRLLTVDVGSLRISSIYAPLAPCGSKTASQRERSICRKIDWLNELKDYIAATHDPSKPSVLCGDFNVVLDGSAHPKRPNRTEGERQALASLLSLGFKDLYRCKHGPGEPGFNSGTPIHIQGTPKAADTRLHLILGTQSIANRLKSVCVDVEYRGPVPDLPGKRWAPGAPVIVNIDDYTIGT